MLGGADALSAKVANYARSDIGKVALSVEEGALGGLGLP